MIKISINASRSYVELLYHIVHTLYGVQCGANLISSEGNAANKTFTKFLKKRLAPKTQNCLMF